MEITRIAARDPALHAVVARSVALHYDDGADELLDRPAHVRAASGLARVGGRVALIQDDSNFLAVIDPQGATVHAITLPAGEGGRRQFDDRRGNKRHKLDLEACIALDTDEGPMLIAFGSGSTSEREHVVLVDALDSGRPRVTVVHVPSMYEALRVETAFAGSELNIEGAVAIDGTIRLFGRGNGAWRGGLSPQNATCDLDQGSLIAHLRSPERTDPPRPSRIIRYEIGSLGDVPLGFTDAAVWGDSVLYSAAAEDSPDTVRDGRVVGSVVGIIDATGRARWAPLVEPGGRPLQQKVEGLLAVAANERRVLAVVDADDPAAASRLCTVELAGEWRADPASR